MLKTDSAKRRLTKMVSLSIATVFLFASGTIPASAQGSNGTRVDLEVSNLENLEEGHYEGWVVDGDERISFGKFNVRTNGDLETLSGKRIKHFETEKDVDDVQDFEITVESDNDDDSTPSDSIILEGDADSSNRADLRFDALDFDDLKGDYIVKAPTFSNPDIPAGVWFFDPDDNEASLDIPDAPKGWKYEGWVVYRNQVPLTTGRFSDPKGPDDFDGYSGDANPAPPFPGQDYIQNLPLGLKGPLLIDDGDSRTAITIEPDIDGNDPSGPLPFQLAPLTSKIPEDIDVDEDFDFRFNRSKKSLPTGKVQLD